MTRDAAEFWWNYIAKRNIHIPKNVAYFKKDLFDTSFKQVTWEDIHKNRTARILSNVDRKRRCEQVKPCIVWVFSHGYWLMGGHYTIIKTLQQEYYLNFRGVEIIDSDFLQNRVMQTFPYLLPMKEFFYDWMVEFVNRNRNNSFYKGWKNQGIAFSYCKIDQYGRLMDISNNKTELRSADSL